jgi:hypothetical protein
MTVYWTDDDQQNQQSQDRPGRSLLNWIRTLLRIRNNKNQQQRRNDNA